MNTDLIARLMASTYMLYISLAGMGARTTLPGRMVAWEGDYVLGLFAIVLLTGLAILLDVVANELIPTRFQWKWVKNKRDMLYIVGGILTLAPTYYVTKVIDVSEAAVALYLVFPVLVMLMGFADVKCKFEANESGASVEEIESTH